MKTEDIHEIVTNHTDQMSRAFQNADTYAYAATPSYHQVGEHAKNLVEVFTDMGHF